MKLLFVTDHFSSVNGASSLSRAHLEILNDIAGSENVYIVSMYTGNEKKPPVQKNNEATLAAYCSKIEKLRNIISLNHVDINDRIIGFCINLIRENQIDCVFIDESYFGKLVKKIKQETNALVMAFYHDIKAFLYREWMRTERKRRIPEFLAGIVNEKWTAKYADYNITLNERENHNFRLSYKRNADFSIPIVLKSQPKVTQAPRKSSIIHLGFLGVYYYPNVNGIRWLCQNVMPFVRNDADLIVAGKGMEKLKEELEQISDNIKVTGTVDVLSEFYASVDVIVAPVFEGAGMKTKTAEAFSYGKPVIGTNESFVGYIENVMKDEISDYVCICDRAEDFILNIRKMNKQLTASNLPGIQEHFERYYSYDAVRRILEPYLMRDSMKRKEYE